MKMESLCVRDVDYLLKKKKNLRLKGTGMSKKEIGSVKDVKRNYKGGRSM
jgi:hypothetical protein